MEECQCPICHSFMKEPVVAADGHSYEQQAITRWLAYHGTSPMTGAQLPSTITVPNLIIARV
eukprot:CAMPEP_0115269130 /NCGR_PEP_ID=MMETSP0270-20121206/52881_1 /TAXON_ID=71861 /ORGANISM="Scrippsiella trochoidea, Strain CCMP3099" /LENGTH=61 /DNA_ID=CAMNT_0002685361 /DNA_START=11 /DNA_END=193 /DNA_ORIENTATION=-